MVNPNYALFDGSDDYLTESGGLTGAANSKSGLLSVWVYLTDTTEAQQSVIDSTYFSLQYIAANGYQLLARNASATVILRSQLAGNWNTWPRNGTVEPFLHHRIQTNHGWVHHLIGWDLATGTVQWCINGGPPLQRDITVTDDSIGYATATTWRVGADAGTPTTFFEGRLAQLYMTQGETLDLSDTDQRQKFIDLRGRPVTLGSDGSTPTGTAPIIFLPFASTATIGTNAGTGGNFTATSSPTVSTDDNSVKFRDAGLYFTQSGERWYACDYCNFSFPASQTTVDWKGNRACLSGPTDFDEDPRKQPKPTNPFEFTS
jgi:hypothetical protein